MKRSKKILVALAAVAALASTAAIAGNPHCSWICKYTYCTECQEL
ncbi:hypothetical protein [Rheinheimera sp.]|nr:hypothetical protein [Rheinheimera sp.]MDP2714405.1 hypothetical protein [Rheinheimera sp.]